MIVEAVDVPPAKAVVVKARFRAPSDKALLGLWNEVRYALAREAIERPAAKPAGDPRTLPFVRLMRETVTATLAGGVVRRDERSRPAPHLMRLRAHRAEPG